MKVLLMWVGGAMIACETAQPHQHAPTPPPASAPASTTSSADELDRLDQRKPLPLLPMMANHQKENMRDHLVVVQEVVAAAAARDFAKVARAARRIGYSEAMGQMCEHMGAGAPGFTEQALAFHHSADRIVDAAKREDSAAVLSALGETLATCTGCHAAYKQKLVDRLP
jgi:hypothetical protein